MTHKTETIYKDLNQVAQERREQDPIVIDFSRGTKDITFDKITEILEALKLRSSKWVNYQN